MVAVAATNVGDIKADFDPEIVTNSREEVSENEKIYKTPINFRYCCHSSPLIFS